MLGSTLVCDKYDDLIIQNPLSALEASKSQKKYLYLHFKRQHSILANDLKGIEETNAEHIVRNDSEEEDSQQDYEEDADPFELCDLSSENSEQTRR